MSNLLIVESENDKYFIEALIQHISLKNISVGSPVCSVDEYECLGGISNLEHSLKALKGQVQKDGVDKIGIIFDADNVGVEDRTQQIQDKIDLVFTTNPSTEFTIHILNIDGAGELESLLKAIKSKDSPMADCLDAWQECLGSKNKDVKQKDFDKFWVDVYHRFDCCDKRERKQAGRKCNIEASFQKPIYDFDHPALAELKDFLSAISA